MHRFSACSGVLAVAALALASGCGGAGTAPALPASGAAAPDTHQRHGHHYDGLVFVSDEDDNAVWVCSVVLRDIRRGFYPPVNQLSGVSDPAQLAVGSDGTLYVANAQTDATGAGAIAEYPRGATSPARTLKTGLNTTTGVAVAANGTVYASNKYWGSVVVFPKGKNAPSETITKNLSGPDGLTVDDAGDLFIADSSANDVLELKVGNKTPQSLHLRNLVRPTGVALDRRGDLYVSNYLGASSNLTVYAPGTTSPAQTIVVPGPVYGSENTIAETMMLSVTNPGNMVIASAPLSLALVGGQQYFGYAPALVGYSAGQTQPAWSVYGVTGNDAVFQPAR